MRSSRISPHSRLRSALLSKLDFAASHVYSSRGQSELSKSSQVVVRNRLKRGDPSLLRQLATRVANLVAEGNFTGFFGNQTTLVPIPGSAPLVRGGLWVPLLAANELRRVGLARDVLPAIARVSAVTKSAFVQPAQRPNVQEHYNSLSVQLVKPPPQRILLIDDVVTQGCTMLAAASRVAEAYPQAEVRGFAFVRTMSGVELEEVVGVGNQTMVSPCAGIIRPRNERAIRQP